MIFLCTMTRTTMHYGKVAAVLLMEKEKGEDVLDRMRQTLTTFTSIETDLAGRPLGKMIIMTNQVWAM